MRFPALPGALDPAQNLGFGLHPVLELVARLEAALLGAVVGRFGDQLPELFGRGLVARAARHRLGALVAVGLGRRGACVAGEIASFFRCGHAVSPACCVALISPEAITHGTTLSITTLTEPASFATGALAP